jgi:ribulose 1,5-bisphosphate carboxylase large subunit-like protein
LPRYTCSRCRAPGMLDITSSVSQKGIMKLDILSRPLIDRILKNDLDWFVDYLGRVAETFEVSTLDVANEIGLTETQFNTLWRRIKETKTRLEKDGKV